MRSMWPDLSAESSFTAFTLSLMAAGLQGGDGGVKRGGTSGSGAGPHAAAATAAYPSAKKRKANAQPGTWSGIGAQRSTSFPNGPQSPL